MSIRYKLEGKVMGSLLMCGKTYLSGIMSWQCRIRLVDGKCIVPVLHAVCFVSITPRKVVVVVKNIW
jgi:hypothetical protein